MHQNLASARCSTAARAPLSSHVLKLNVQINGMANHMVIIYIYHTCIMSVSVVINESTIRVVILILQPNVLLLVLYIDVECQCSINNESNG